MKLIDRIGVDVGRRLKLEDAIDWAAKGGLRHIDIQLDTGKNAMPLFDAKRCAGVRKLLDKHGLKLGLHTNSAVNVAEYSPVVSDAVTDYLKRYVDIVPKLGASWTEMHAGYHFTRDKQARMDAGKERLKRVVPTPRKRGRVLLETSTGAADAEIHYLAHTVEEWQYYWDIKFRISNFVSPSPRAPRSEGIEGFVKAITSSGGGSAACRHWRNGYESLNPARATSISAHVQAVEGRGPRAYTNAFGSLDDMVAGRDYLVARAREAGVRVD